MRHVRDVQQQILLLFGSCCCYGIQLFNALTHLAHALFEGFRLFAAPFFHHEANLLGCAVTLGRQGLLFRLGIAALYITLKHLIYKHPVVSATQAYTLFHILRIFPDNSDI